MTKMMIESKAIRITLIMLGVLVWLGIWLTGFAQVHWLLYIPAIALVFAGITGICPSYMINKTLLREN